MLYSFPPLINSKTRVLVVGSMPGAASLKAQEYYAYKYNQFWRIIFDLFAGGRIPQNYEDKKQVLLSKSIGLWDALAACQREGSLDGNIKEPTPNDFPMGTFRVGQHSLNIARRIFCIRVFSGRMIRRISIYAGSTKNYQ